MKHKVIKYFCDKESGVYYMPDSFYICDDYERVILLQQLGIIQVNEEVETLTKPKKATRKKKASDNNATKSQESITD
ncbi:hypothetical protein SAMN05880501_10760 [Ureibacillus xyleni]|uniref:Uncharacterized protein n=1 Tax=Ureibacillus xyleni TaxID=614648 RepID=A0A285SXQ0_9BACL|nr:hypothetical protein [Ureibacillus xyleni]SOC12839.1 hypothetical protein SAMN05880501_10760 [Ureibacillus xyleni]